MKWYRLAFRMLFAVIFTGGGIAHFVLGRLQPEGYAVFAGTALIPGLRDLWFSFVMPNIGWLTIVLGCYELVCGLGILWKRTVSFAALGMIVFLVFIAVVGYGFPAGSWGQDLLINRLGTIVMIGLLLPLLPTSFKDPAHSAT